METLDCIKTRRSIRKYRDIPVEQDKLARIIDAASWAPSAGNVQNWSFLIINSFELIQSVAEACHQQYWIGTAPAVILVCSDPEKAGHLYGDMGRDKYSRQNCAAAVQNMLLAAHELGLGSCWVGSGDEQKLKDLFSVPDHIEIEAILTLGYPAEDPDEPSRFVLYDQVFFNTWEGRFKDTQWAEKDYAGSVWGKIFEQKDRLMRNKDKYKEKAQKTFNQLKSNK